MAESAYKKGVLITASILAAKACAIHLLTINARLVTEDFKTGRASNWPEDSCYIVKKLGDVFRFLTFGANPFSIERLTGVARNSAENEPYFIGLALAYGQCSEIAPFAPQLLSAFWISRVLHTVFFLTSPPQPLRATAYSVGLGAMLTLAISALTGRK